MRSFVIFGLRPRLWPRLRGGDEPGLGALADQPGFVFGHQGKHAEDEFAVGGGGVDDPVGQRPHPDPAAFEGGDDVDEVRHSGNAALPVVPREHLTPRPGVRGRRGRR